MKPYIFLLFVCSFANVLIGQSIKFNWQNCYNGPLNDKCYDIVATDDGYFIVGSYEFPNAIPPSFTQIDIWLIKTDLSGNFLWEKWYGGSANEGPSNIVRAIDGNYYIFGGAGSSDGDISFDPYPQSVDFWIIKIDSSGKILWNRIVGGNGTDIPYNATATTDGGIVCLGWTSSFDGDVSQYYGDYDMWLIKLDSIGEKQWDYTIGTSDFDYGYAVIQTLDGGFLVGGPSNIENGGNIQCNPFNSNEEAVVFKLDSNGNQQWQHCYGGSRHDGVEALLEVEDGYVIGCYGGSDDGDLTGSGWHGNSNDGNTDIWIIKADFYGNILWQKCYGGTGFDFTGKIFKTSDNNLMVFGTTYSFDGDVIGNHSISAIDPDIWMIKISNSGELVWQRCIGGAGPEWLENGVIQKNDFDYTIACTALPWETGDMTCESITPYSQGIWAFEITDTTIMGYPMISEISNIIKLYPNPVEDILFVDIPESISIKDAIIQVIDANGKTVSEQRPDSRLFQLELSQNSSGLYLLKLLNDKLFVTAKFFRQ